MIKGELVWEVDRITQIVSDNLRDLITESYPAFIDIRSDFGPADEMKQGLADLSKSDHRAEKWPFVGLFRPYDTISGRGEYDSVRITLLIAMFTTPDWKSRDRQTNNFEPILLPIYRELMRQIRRSKFFVVMDPARDMPHRMIEHDYFGRKRGDDRNKLFHDYVDAIEIRDLELKLSKSNNCC